MARAQRRPAEALWVEAAGDLSRTATEPAAAHPPLVPRPVEEPDPSAGDGYPVTASEVEV
jgi:hypothetical protein